MTTKKEIKEYLKNKRDLKLNAIYSKISNHRKELANTRYNNLIIFDENFKKLMLNAESMFEHIRKMSDLALLDLSGYRNANILTIGGYCSSFEDYKKSVLLRLERKNDDYITEQLKFIKSIENEYDKIFNYLSSHTSNQTLKMLSENGIKIEIKTNDNLPEVIKINKNII